MSQNEKFLGLVELSFADLDDVNGGSNSFSDYGNVNATIDVTNDFSFSAGNDNLNYTYNSNYRNDNGNLSGGWSQWKDGVYSSGSYGK
jgi:hypothetical protein